MTHDLSLSRRQVLQRGLATVVAGTALPSALAASAAPGLTAPAYTAPPDRVSPVPPRGLAAVSAVLQGIGVYIGNDWFDWDDNARRFALAKVRAWGFDFVCPKIGGYGRTYYQDAAHLRHWSEAAHGIGLGFVPFLYTIPETGALDARIAAQIANTIGIVCVDMEDEWGPKEPNAAPGYRGAEMANFGRIYRQEAGDAPIIVTGYGDPITRFGAGVSGFPYAEMMAWADAYSPQWYIGVYSKYHKGGVQAALDWCKQECSQALGPHFAICPSVDLECLYTPNSLFPLADTVELMTAMRAYQSPVFVWEYGLITPEHAEALLGLPQITNVRIGRQRTDSLEVLWDTHVPARALFSCQLSSGKAQSHTGTTLNLTHAEGASKLTPSTAYPMVVQASSGGGTSAPVSLTAATSPQVPGLYVLAAMAARTVEDHLSITVTLANSAEESVSDVVITAVSLEGGSVIAPAALPYSIGPLGAYDWATRTANRATLTIIAAKIASDIKTITLHLTGTAAPGQQWSGILPVTI